MEHYASPSWIPFKEPLQTTLLRTGAIALVLGTVILRVSAFHFSWPVAVLMAMWPSFGGHWIELWFLNWLRPRITPRRGVQALARVGTWGAGGIAIAVMMRLIAGAFGAGDIAPRIVWLGAPAFIVVELLAHAALAARGRPNVFDGHG